MVSLSKRAASAISKIARPVQAWLADRRCDAAAAKLSATPPNLYRIDLAAGTHGPISIGWRNHTGAELDLDPRDWLSLGYDGVDIVGAGPEATIVRNNSWAVDGITVAITRHPGIVRLRNMKIVAGPRCAIHAGEDNPSRIIERRFQLHLINVHGLVLAPNQLPPNANGQHGRTLWWGFSYNCDIYLYMVVIDATEASEHGWYAHGAANLGYLVVACIWIGTGAEQFKVRPDYTETAWVGSQVVCVITDCTFQNWHQLHSSRGGNGIDLQGANVTFRIERCWFWGGQALPSDGTFQSISANLRAMGFAVSAEGNCYEFDTGAQGGTGFANGHGIIRNCGFWGDSDVPWRNEIIYCGTNGGGLKPCKSLTIQNCGIWGRNMKIGVTRVPAGKFKVVGCNTAALRQYARAAGMDDSFEAFVPTATRLVPASEGIVQ